MKLKVITLATFGILLYSCASKSPAAAPIVEAKEKPIVKLLTSDSNAMVLKKDYLEGKNLFENNCAKCHKLYDPKDFSAQEWKPILKRMQKQANLEDAQIENISNYITSQL